MGWCCCGGNLDIIFEDQNYLGKLTRGGGQNDFLRKYTPCRRHLHK